MFHNSSYFENDKMSGSLLMWMRRKNIRDGASYDVFIRKNAKQKCGSDYYQEDPSKRNKRLRFSSRTVWTKKRDIDTIV